MNIREGDTVVVEERGVSDPQVMEVEDVASNEAWCVWWEDKEQRGDYFPISDLKKVQ